MAEELMPFMKWLDRLQPVQVNGKDFVSKSAVARIIVEMSFKLKASEYSHAKLMADLCDINKDDETMRNLHAKWSELAKQYRNEAMAIKMLREINTAHTVDDRLREESNAHA